ncbi:dicarboxylate:amino acid:cation symporter DAACS family protein [Algimonas arctica]|uniref:Dicarboxylate:amino acid:cation symporter DAACS family protein n=1 Tax=Algimonas arctica TaxID=1479486 RepID=A0A8J3CUJ2_9PROT|nr:dicarboxylate/amino acid:cation symporter [Algimonas arctica]GHB04044.1 dicarboxylate:amino acid:cation symporter DAACS family protein [Algimonas arctica]
MLNKMIALGLFLGLCVGLGAAMTESPVLYAIARESAPVGKLFINAINMVVIPLVVVIIFSSVARLGDVRKLGKIGGMTMAFYWMTLVPAILIGMAVMTLGLQFVPDMVTPPADDLQIPQLQSMTDFIVSLIPPNPFAAAADGKILPLIVFTALFAAAVGTLPVDRKDRMISTAEDIGDALIKMVWWILFCAPVGVFGLIAPATAQMGWGLIQSLGVFILCVTLGLLIFVGLVFVPLLLVFAKMGPVRFFKSILGSSSIAFSTTSTVAAIPVTLEEVTHNLNVSETTADLLIPFGASIFRPGSALFQGAAIVFLAHIYGVPIAAGTVGAVLLATFLVSLTVAPVPSSSVVTMAPALDAIGVPVAGLALVLGIDRIPDMMRSVVNLVGQITAAVLVDKQSSQADAKSMKE